MDAPTGTVLDRDGLARLTAEVRRDLERIDHPADPWRPDDDPVLDVLVVGAGQGGLATAFQLLRDKVTNIRVIDRAPRGLEGPWRRFARMRTLRSPKAFNGPDLGVPALTYRAWHEACFGVASWQQMSLIPTGHWATYLDWFRDVLALPVTNDVSLEKLTDAAGLVEATLRHGDGRIELVRCRRVVLATGVDGLGRWWMPAPIEALPPPFRAHSADAIDFAALAGKRVAVIGAGASAADNAAVALEHGAAEVRMLCRRRELQCVQPYRWLTFTGFLRHLSDMDDAWRWRFMRHILELRESFPQETYERCRRFGNFSITTGAAVEAARVTPASDVALTTGAGCIHTDYVICGTGIDVDMARRPELAPFADAIALWGDRHAPEPGLEDARLARYPYLAADYSFTEKVPGVAPILRKLHVFNFGATMSFGPSGSSINAMTIAVPKLVSGITRALFAEAVDDHWQSLRAYDTPLLQIDRVA